MVLQCYPRQNYVCAVFLSLCYFLIKYEVSMFLKLLQFVSISISHSVPSVFRNEDCNSNYFGLHVHSDKKWPGNKGRGEGGGKYGFRTITY